MTERKSRLRKNLITGLMLQIVTVICGFILPRLILENFGSNVNGLIMSIGQFLAFIGFLDLGVGAVVQSNLYKPLALNDWEMVSKIVSSADKFFKTIAKILGVYIILLMFIYPMIIKNNFSYKYISLLVLILGIGTFSRYYLGIVEQLLIIANQRGYVQYSMRIITLILATILGYTFMKLGFGIHIVELVIVAGYIIRPIILKLYVNKNYEINRNIKYDIEPIKQKWNGLMQHVASIILNSTDVVVLTFFSTISMVSVYGIYNLVIQGIKQIIFSFTNGVKELIGEMYAKKELSELKEFFEFFEWAIHSGTTLIFGIASTLIVSFVMVYTSGVNDVNYNQPLFGLLLLLANAGHCLRLPYNILILAAGHYKQTQNNYIIVAILNLSLSVLLVYKFGIIGVAIGTLVAMIYQTIWMANYSFKNIVNLPLSNFFKHLVIDIVVFICGVLLSNLVKFKVVDFKSWTVYAIIVSIIWLIVVILINSIFYNSNVLSILKKIKRKQNAK